MSFLEPRISFSSNFASLVSVMRYNSSVLFHLHLYVLWRKRSPSKCKFPDFPLLAWKLTKYLLSFFKPRGSFLLNFASPFSVMIHNSFWNFLAETLYTLDKKSPSMYTFSDIWMLQWKLTQFLMPFLKAKGQGLFKFCIIIQCYERLFFGLKSRILWTKRSHRIEISKLLSGWVKIYQIPHVTFEPTS